MDYGAVFRDGWRGAFRSGGAWAFLALMYAAFTAIGALAALVSWRLGLVDVIGDLLDGTPSFSRALLVLAPFLAGALLALPVYLVFHGGLVELTRRAQEGRPSGLVDGFVAGARNAGRVLVLDAAWAAVAVVAYGALTGVFVGIAVAFGASLYSSQDFVGTPGRVTAVIVFCCGYGLFGLVALVLGMFLNAAEAVGVRYAVLAGMPPLTAFAQGWGRWRDRFKDMLLMSLLVVGVKFLMSMAGQAVMVPLQFVPPGSAAYWVAFAGLYAVTLALQLPFVMFIYSVWTAFFRQLVAPPPPVQAGAGEESAWVTTAPSVEEG